MAHFITIAGPQSSGKTVAINHLKKKHPKWYFMEVIDPYTIGGMDHAGAAYTDRDLQKSLLKIELIKINSMHKKTNPVLIAEMGIMRLVYASHFYDKKLANEYFEQYVDAYESFNSHIIFIDTKPEQSFSRRRNKYIERIKNRGIKDKKKFDKALKKYEDTIFRLYPHWLKLFNKIPFPKTIIKNSHISEAEFLSEIDKTVGRIISAE